MRPLYAPLTVDGLNIRTNSTQLNSSLDNLPVVLCKYLCNFYLGRIRAVACKSLSNCIFSILQLTHLTSWCLQYWMGLDWIGKSTFIVQIFDFRAFRNGIPHLEAIHCGKCMQFFYLHLAIIHWLILSYDDVLAWHVTCTIVRVFLLLGLGMKNALAYFYLVAQFYFFKQRNVKLRVWMGLTKTTLHFMVNFYFVKYLGQLEFFA